MVIEPDIHATLPESIIFTSRIRSWFLALLIGGSVLLLLIAWALHMAVPIAFILVIIYGFLCLRFFKSNATLFINDGLLLITSHANIFQITTSLEIPLANIRGFEISQDRNFTSLAIHNNDLSITTIPIVKTNEIDLVSKYASQHLPIITEKSNPYFKNFGSAFWFAFPKCALATLPSFLAILIYTFYDPMMDNVRAFLSLCLLAAVVSFFTYWLLVRRHMIEKQFRRHARGIGSWLILTLSNFAFCALLFKTAEFREPITQIQSIKEIRNLKNHALFSSDKVTPIFIENPVKHVDFKYRTKGPDRILHHGIMIPMADKADQGNKGENVWLNKIYVQKISKSYSSELVRNYATKFQSLTEEKLRRSLSKTPEFYKVIHSDLNDVRLEKKLADLLRRNSRDMTSIIIVEASWESMSDRRSNIIWFTIAMVAGILVSILLSAYQLALER